MTVKDIRKIKNNPTLEGMAVMIPDVVFSSMNGVELKMQILLPWSDDQNNIKKAYPLIVFVQGSAWTFPDVYYQLPQLAQFAREGYVVATLTHRNCLEGNPFPAFLQDVKTGIRFLRKNAEKYQIDSDRVGIWGTSSGGNTSLLVGLTIDDKRYSTDEHSGYSDKVNMVIDCFGPVNIADMLEYNSEHLKQEENPILTALLGGKVEEKADVIRELDPVSHIKSGEKYPPFLLLHGDADSLVDYRLTEKLYHQMLNNDMKVDMVCIEGAPHEGSFWSNELLGIIRDFIKENL